MSDKFQHRLHEFSSAEDTLTHLLHRSSSHQELPSPEVKKRMEEKLFLALDHVPSLVTETASKPLIGAQTKSGLFRALHVSTSKLVVSSIAALAVLGFGSSLFSSWKMESSNETKLPTSEKNLVPETAPAPHTEHIVPALPSSFQASSSSDPPELFKQNAAPAPAMQRSPLSGFYALSKTGATLELKAKDEEKELSRGETKQTEQVEQTQEKHDEISPKPLESAATAAFIAPLAPHNAHKSELEILEHARTALLQKDFQKAKEALEEHHRKYPSGILFSERELLYIEYLAETGNHKEACAKAKTWLIRSSTYAGRLSELIKNHCPE